MAKTFIDKNFTTFNTSTMRMKALALFSIFSSWNLVISLSFWLEGKLWKAFRLPGFNKIPVVISINSHALVSLVVSGILIISIHSRRECCSFFQHCLSRLIIQFWKASLTDWLPAVIPFFSMSCLPILVGLSAVLRCHLTFHSFQGTEILIIIYFFYQSSSI